MRKKILVLGVMLAVLLGGVFYSLTMKILQRDKIMPSLASEIVPNSLNLLPNVDIFYDFYSWPSSTKIKSDDYVLGGLDLIFNFQHNMHNSPGVPEGIYSKYFLDFNGDGLSDIVYYRSTESSRYAAILLNNGKLSFDVAYKCVARQADYEPDDHTFYGTCADPDYPL